MLRQVVLDATCHECTALRLVPWTSHGTNNDTTWASTDAQASTTLGFESDNLPTQLVMSSLVSLIIVGFSVLLVRETR